MVLEGIVLLSNKASSVQYHVVLYGALIPWVFMVERKLCLSGPICGWHLEVAWCHPRSFQITFTMYTTYKVVTLIVSRYRKSALSLYSVQTTYIACLTLRDVGCLPCCSSSGFFHWLFALFSCFFGDEFFPVEFRGLRTEGVAHAVQIKHLEVKCDIGAK